MGFSIHRMCLCWLSRNQGDHNQIRLHEGVDIFPVDLDLLEDSQNRKQTQEDIIFLQ